MNKRIGIIGGGFAGTMTIVHLVENSSETLEIFLLSEASNLNKGVAYNPYSEKHILNVITGKMSAYPDRPEHFLDWVMTREEFFDQDRNLVSNSFLPRKLYGEYLSHIWEKTLGTAKSNGTSITVLNATVTDLQIEEHGVSVMLSDGSEHDFGSCVIATGNQLPRNPKIKNKDFYNRPEYFQNPWKIESVKGLGRHEPVLIIGNGLTMVDTVLGLLEQGFENKIYSISPNGFNILPHRHNGAKYTELAGEIKEGMSLIELVRLVNKHIKKVRKYGVSAEPIIDSLRPYTQKLWRSFTELEKKKFVSRLRHLWGVARHRIPLHTHDKIQQLRIDGKLVIESGRIVDISHQGQLIKVEYFDKKLGSQKEIEVCRVINCTGPETDFMAIEESFIKKCVEVGILSQDNLKLGLRTDIETFRTKRIDGTLNKNLYTIGSNLKGELWESTAVNELREQAKKLAVKLTD